MTLKFDVNSYLYNFVKIDGVGGSELVVCKVRKIGGVRRKFACKDRRGGGKEVYLYTVKIGNFRQMLMSSLIFETVNFQRVGQWPCYPMSAFMH